MLTLPDHMNSPTPYFSGVRVAQPPSCNQLTLHLPSTESSANVLQSQPTCIVQNVNENNPMDVT